MDRNYNVRQMLYKVGVALRKESVDRNLHFFYKRFIFDQVALRKESVDRNGCVLLGALGALRVALRKESVDRNCAANPFAEISQGRSPQGERG